MGKVVLTGIGSAVLMAPVLTAQAVAAPARARAAVRSARAELVGPTVRYGDHDAGVEKLQQRLKDLGYDPGAVDGEWGRATSFAVWAFQKVNHINPSPHAGRKTWAALALPRLPEPLVPKGAKNRAEVDVKHQLVAKLLPIGARVYVRG